MGRTMRIVLLGMVTLVAAGCTKYYKVTDPTTGKVYYTTKMTQKSSGATTLTDARTGNKVSLQNSEVTEVKKEEYESGKNTAPAK